MILIPWKKESRASHVEFAFPLNCYKDYLVGIFQAPYGKG